MPRKKYNERINEYQQRKANEKREKEHLEHDKSYKPEHPDNQ